MPADLPLEDDYYKKMRALADRGYRLVVIGQRTRARSAASQTPSSLLVCDAFAIPSQAGGNQHNPQVVCAIEMIEMVETFVQRQLEYVLAISRHVHKVVEPARFWQAIDAALGKAPTAGDVYMAGVWRGWDPTLPRTPNTNLDLTFVGLRAGLLARSKAQFFGM